MSRNSERSLSSDSMETSDTSDNSGQDWGVFDGQMSPYGDEPLAEVCDDQSSDSDDEETDSNGLTPAVLAARLVVSTWCSCEGCKDKMQVGSQEFRCCGEVVHSSSKMVFDGSIERIKCITQHEDYDAITNRAVLQQVAPLL
ncbi:uncharacterized protein LOC141859706 [Acropora palmata]|uniref:uncharacterized protein LOC141859706 n=1 Tax=Acropora palmata TaxID=6131 RepID=UPI003DA10AE9